MIHNFDLSGNVYSGKRIVASDHDCAVTAFVEHLDRLDRIFLEWGLKHKESSKVQIAFNFFSL